MKYTEMFNPLPRGIYSGLLTAAVIVFCCAATALSISRSGGYEGQAHLGRRRTLKETEPIRATRSAIDIDNLSEAQVAKALSGEPCVIPFHFNPKGCIVVPIQSGKKQYNFLLDTGCAQTKKWKRFGEELPASELISLADGESVYPGQVSLCKFVDFRIGSICFNNLLLTVIADSPDKPLSFGDGEDGIIGGDLLRHFTVCVDYEHKLVILRDPKKPLPFSSSAVFIPFELEQNRPFVTNIGIDNQLALKGTLDTACEDIVVSLDAVHTIAKFDQRLFVNVAGMSYGRMKIGFHQFTSLSLNRLKVANPICTVRTINTTDPLPEIILGASFLSRYKVTFDYLGNMAVFEARERATETVPELIQLGRYYEHQNKTSEAADAYEKLCALDRDLIVPASQSLCALQMHSREFTKAVETLSKLIELSPDNPVFLGNRAKCYLFLREEQKALADYSKAITLKPRLAALYLGRARVYKIQKNFASQLVDCNQAITLQPDLAEAYAEKANALANMGSYDEALSNCNQSIKIDPTCLFAYQIRGWLFEKTGQHSLAQLDQRKAELLRKTDKE